LPPDQGQCSQPFFFGVWLAGVVEAARDPEPDVALAWFAEVSGRVRGVSGAAPISGGGGGAEPWADFRLRARAARWKTPFEGLGSTSGRRPRSVISL
jgi:hypothetical protein